MATRGILSPIDFSSETESDFSAYLRQIFVNETPLVARLPRVRGNSETFTIISYDVRGRSYTLGANIAADNTTTLTLGTTGGGVSPLLVGDVLAIGTERVEVASIVSTSANTITVRRGVEGTTPANSTSSASTHSNTNAVTLIGNSRTGSEVDQEAQRAARTTVTQTHQTFQFPVQVGGKAQAVSNIRLPSGDTDIFSSEQKAKMVEMMRDEEYTSFYGIGEAPSAVGDRGKQKGLKTLITAYSSGANVTTSPTNASAYKPTDLIRDTFQKAMAGGGRPDVLFVSVDFMAGLATWGFNTIFSTDQRNAFGTPIDSLYLPLGAGTVQIIPSLQLSSGTAVALTSQEVQWSYLRPESWKPRGSRGDAFEGDWLADGCVKLINPGHHAWTQGITGFAKQS